jgi:hypothetical protein
MENNQYEGRFQGEDQTQTGASQRDVGSFHDGQTPIQKPVMLYKAPAFVILAIVALVLIALLAILPEREKAPRADGVDKNGVPIIEMSKRQVMERVAEVQGKPLNEAEANAVFRWVAGHQDEAARLTAEQKSQIIRALNQ